MLFLSINYGDKESIKITNNRKKYNRAGYQQDFKMDLLRIWNQGEVKDDRVFGFAATSWSLPLFTNPRLILTLEE